MATCTAHGWSTADSLVAAEVVAADGDIEVWDGPRLAFGYRTSALKADARHLVTRAVLAVHRDESAAILGRVADYTAHRKRTQPATPSVGSVFKNPPGDHAGRLIDAAGLKGIAHGGARISPVHANFFVNLGGGTARDALALVDLVEHEVARQFGVALVREFEIW